MPVCMGAGVVMLLAAVAVVLEALTGTPPPAPEVFVVLLREGVHAPPGGLQEWGFMLAKFLRCPPSTKAAIIRETPTLCKSTGQSASHHRCQ